MNTKNTKRGRPKTPVVWPEGEFTAKQAFSANSEKVSRVSIHNKINEALSEGALVVIKKSQSSSGRPSNIYQTTGHKVPQSALSPLTQTNTDDLEELDF